MTFYRHEARGLTVGGEMFVYGIHSSNIAGALATAHSTWIAANTKMWGGTAPPADSIKQLYTPAYQVVQHVTTELNILTGKNQAQLISQAGLAGTGSGEAFPPQVAICVSLRTLLPTRAGRGRFFLPAPIVSTIATGRLTGTAQDQIVKAVGLMLSTMKAAGYGAVILHRGSMSSDAVTSYDVGNVFDTMRTRRDKLIEVRQTAAAALSAFLRDEGPEPDPADLAAETPITNARVAWVPNRGTSRQRGSEG